MAWCAREHSPTPQMATKSTSWPWGDAKGYDELYRFLLEYQPSLVDGYADANLDRIATAAKSVCPKFCKLGRNSHLKAVRGWLYRYRSVPELGLVIYRKSFDKQKRQGGKQTQRKRKRQGCKQSRRLPASSREHAVAEDESAVARNAALQVVHKIRAVLPDRVGALNETTNVLEIIPREWAIAIPHECLEEVYPVVGFFLASQTAINAESSCRKEVRFAKCADTYDIILVYSCRASWTVGFP